MSATLRYQEILNKVEELRKEASALALQLFNEGSQELFQKHPKLKEFSWTQYTPYWLDGDECTFGVYSEEPEINECDYWDESDEDFTEDEFKALQDEVAQFICLFH